MKKGLIRQIAFGIIAAMVISIVPYQYTMATDVGEIADEQIEEIPELTEETESVSDEVISEEYNEEIDKSIEAVDAAEQHSQDRPEQKLNYIYVEKPYLEIPDEQNIVISWGDGSDEITDLSLVYQKENSDEFQEIESSLNAGELFLFKKEFSKEDEKGIYSIISIKMTVNGAEAEYTLEELGTEAFFGVNREYDGYKENSVQVCTEEGEILELSEESSVEISTVSLDEDGNISGEESIETALEEAEPDHVAEGVAAFFSMDANGNSRAGERSNELVVAIDAGHDNIDAGAYYNGLREEVLTLKIAEYCKAELEKYAGVRVYMTRTGEGCPVGVTSSPHAGTCIDKRVKKAAEAGADVVVSIHLNASVVSSAHGAEVIIPNKNWKPEQNTEGTELAKQILSQLASLGLQNRGIYWRDTTENEKYPDGSASDYFTIHNSGKEYGVTAMIVEHAFLSNKGSVDQSLLSSEEGLKKLGVADATGIAKYYGLSKVGDRVSIPEGTYTLVSALNSQKVATVSGESWKNKTPIVLNDNNKKSSQRFEIHSAGGGAYTITAEHSGKVLDIDNGSSSAGTPVQQFDENGTQAQKWTFINAGGGYYYLRSGVGTYLDVDQASTKNGTPLQGFTYNGTQAQKWKLVKSDYRPIENGTYTISNGKNTGLVLDVNNASLEDNANVQLFSNNGSAAQHFEVIYEGSGYYRIIAEHSGKYLDVENNSREERANLQQYQKNNMDAQLWKFIEAGNGAYYIRSKCGTVISAATSGNPTSGVNAYMKNMSENALMQWKLKKAEYRPIKDGEYVIVNKSAPIQTITEVKGNIQLETFDNIDNQKFKITYQNNGYYRIALRKTGKVLDIANGSSALRTNVQQFTWNGTDAQLWKFIPDGNGGYYIKSKLGVVLDADNGNVHSGTNIQTYEMNGTNAQKWILNSSMVSMSEKPLKNGMYIIQNTTGSNQVMDVDNASYGAHANIQTFTKNDTSAQRFEITYVKNGYYKIAAEHSGKVLDVDNASKKAGANVQQFDWNGTDAQLWKFIKTDSGNYYLKSKLGTVLDLNRARAISGANVQMGEAGTRSAQMWKIKDVSETTVANGIYMIGVNDSENYVLDIDNASKANGANVQIFMRNGTAAQQFKVINVEKGYCRIESVNSGKVLEYVGIGSRNGANVRQNKWSGTANQLWKFIKNSDGSYCIRSKNGRVMDVNNGLFRSGSNVQIFDANGTAAQKWSMISVLTGKSVAVKEGVYEIQTALSKNRVLDISNASSQNGANVQIYQNNNTQAQKFRIVAVSDGYYKIISAASDKALDVENASALVRANIQQFDWNGTNAQLWRFVDAGNGQYYIQSKLGTVLDVQEGISASGTNVQTFNWNKSNAQKWVLKETNRALYRIMGNSEVTVNQMVKYFEAQRRDGKPLKYPYTKKDGAANITEFCRIYLEEAKAEGVKAEVAFAQAMKETGFLKFGGDVKKEQYNFAGIGAVGGGAQGAQFKDIRTGIRAQIQHLKAYASKDALNQKCVDPRFNYVKRGSAEYVEDLGGKWATGLDYGYSIVDDYIKPMMKH